MELHQYTNKLIGETSPYLLQHAHNPVNWYPWGPEALHKAKEENKLILISIGYAACHWCHVMEKESFENAEIAGIMNQNYICIKVDREERPDIDQIYMEAVQIMNGNGGWPLNCFALPDGRPIYGGTYFRPQQWIQIIEGLSASYKSDINKFTQFASELMDGMKAHNNLTIKSLSGIYRPNQLSEIVEPWKMIFDLKEGGSKGSPKFPMPGSLLFLQEYYFHSKDSNILNHLNLSLDKMARGGIYDQIGGGFARYSVDGFWHVPHFEKMLYDNAQLVQLYSKAYQINKNEEYKRVVYQTLEFIQRDLTSPQGAFYSSLDADSEGEEGKFYVWENQEVINLIDAEANLFFDYYNFKESGNWEHQKNIPFRTNNTKLLATKYNIHENEIVDNIDKCNKILLSFREKRIKPGLDDKILTSWNALMLNAYITAYRVFDENRFLEKALLNANYLASNAITAEFKIFRDSKNNKLCIVGFLDDYAITIDAFIELYQATFEEKWVNLANKLCEFVISHFYDEKDGMFFYTSDFDEKLIVRKKEIHDNVIPSSNSMMANNLYTLGQYFYNDRYMEISAQMLENVRDDIKNSGLYYSNWACLLEKFIYPPFEIGIVGPEYLNFCKEFDKMYLPNVVFAGSNEKSTLPILENRLLSDKTTIYVCRDRVCKMPVYSVEEAIQLMNSKN